MMQGNRFSAFIVYHNSWLELSDLKLVVKIALRHKIVVYTTKIIWSQISGWDLLQW
jgi:hypothetical protein